LEKRDGNVYSLTSRKDDSIQLWSVINTIR